ncbi:unnamed protein product [Didymodactylos carnosus]|uniref:Vitelline membrane outer layer protein 1 n=1 Tax=Didymodactylos carnosus TaxID=1234261 RepID=A0A815WXX8_9BILA|nr:unnamed protein product [Didymodactylos carnosus]CAF4411428.1 unnamed protein product [Didymodactylos carnosus]
MLPAHGKWGSERGWGYCSVNKWAIGFAQKVEANRARADDTAMNSLKLVCASFDGSAKEHVVSVEGHWGDWGDFVYCPGDSGNFLSGAEFKIEKPQGAGIGAQDDTAANDVRFNCSKSTTTLTATNGEKWGTWRGMVTCPINAAICGFSLIWEDNQHGLDDTAANGAKFQCCWISMLILSDL